MKKVRRSGSSSLLWMGLALCFGLALAPKAQASFTIFDNGGNATALTTVTMAQLNSGYYLVIDDKKFYNFTGTYSSVPIVGGPTPIAASSIIVTPLDSPGNNPGLQYQGPFLVHPGQELDTAWSYTVATLNGAPLIEDSSLSLGGAVFSAPISSITVGETLTDSSGNIVAPLMTFAINAPPVVGTVKDAKFFKPVNLVDVSKDILLDASKSSGDPSTGAPTGFTTMIQRFSQTPEPSTMALAGLGALGLIGYGLRRRKVVTA